VLIVMGSALLVATALIFMTQAEVATSAGTHDRAQSRALAWSGLQVIMARLDEQRDSILAGRAATFEEDRLEIYETDSNLGVVRLLAIGPDGEHIVHEAGKLDLNRVDAEMLADTGLIDVPLADAVIAHRETLGRPFQSVGELLEVEGMTPETLYGPFDELADLDREPSRDEAALRGLADVVTVYSVEPAIQLNNRLRINLNVEWSDELGDRVARRFGVEASEMLRQIIEGGTTFDSEARIFEVLRFFEVEPDEWPELVDTFTTESGELHFGRLDINTAPYEALAALPGLEPEQANEIVQSREDLSDEQRESIAWPAILGIVEPEAYDELAGRITTRCWTYRVRFAAAEEDLDAPEDEEAPSRHEVVYEAVVDLAAPRVRVAYLREMTLFSTVVLIASQQEAETDDLADLGPEEPTDPEATEETDDALAADPQPEPPAQDPAEVADARRIGRWLEGR
jgi:DNA uptake protein ComE-like DNA-binding protein